MKKIGDIARAILPKYEPCENCNSGWILDRPARVPGAQRLRRCPCFLAHQERIKALAETAKER